MAVKELLVSGEIYTNSYKYVFVLNSVQVLPISLSN